MKEDDVHAPKEGHKTKEKSHEKIDQKEVTELEKDSHHSETNLSDIGI